MSCEGHDSEADAAAEGRRPRRRREIYRSFTCISPSFIFWRWFNGGKSRFSRTKFAERNWGKGKIDADLDVQRELGMVSPSSPSTKDFSEIGKEASVNVGIGYGLIYLVRIELNKMVELRKRILLQHLPTEIENKDDAHLYMPSASSICSSLTKAHVEEILYVEGHESVQCSSPNDVDQPEIGFRCDRFRLESSSRMDQLEAELEAELSRLQLEEDGEFLHPEVNVEQNAAELSLNMCFSRDEFHGASPRDLERKLYKVLEVRQQERINELESALEYAVQQLEEKEREVSLWRDAGSLVAQHLPAISTMLAQL